MANTCALCRKEFDGDVYTAYDRSGCCKKCYNSYQRDCFIKTDKYSQRLRWLNNIFSMIGNCASLAFVVGVIMLFGSKRTTGITIIAVCSAIIMLGVLVGFFVDAKTNKRIKEKAPNIEIEPMFWEES